MVVLSEVLGIKKDRVEKILDMMTNIAIGKDLSTLPSVMFDEAWHGYYNAREIFFIGMATERILSYHRERF